MVTLMRRGRIWWIQFREEGRRVRESLKTTNRKVAEDLRLRRQIELAQSRYGGSPVGSTVPPLPAVGAGVAAAVPAAPVAVPFAAPVAVPAQVPAQVDPADKPLAEVRAEYTAWSKAHKRAKTIRNDQGRLDAFFATVPNQALPAIRTAEVERYLTSLAGGGRSPATLLRNREILHAFWRWALRQGYVRENIIAAIPRPRLPERDPVFLSLAQVDELLAAVAGTVVEGPVATAVFAGLRREELCWLTWDDLELDRQPAILRVRSKVVAGEAWQPKTKRDRKVPVSPRLLAVLQLIERRKGVPWLLASPDGCRWDPDNLGRAFRAVTQAAGLPWNLLQLRHTFGSQLARKGVSLLKIARLMGNSPLIASKHYINLVPEEMADEVAFQGARGDRYGPVGAHARPPVWPDCLVVAAAPMRIPCARGQRPQQAIILRGTRFDWLGHRLDHARARVVGCAATEVAVDVPAHGCEPRRQAACRRRRCRWPWWCIVEARRPRGHGRKFTSRDLELIRLGERLGLALDIVGISPRSTMSVRDPVLHVLRHTFGSRLARKGVSRLKIARLMSNSPLIARKLYINLVPEEMADEVAF